MLFLRIIIFLLYLSYSYCRVSYELNVQGEPQHGYFISVFLGTPPQTVNLLLDTGSNFIAIATIPPMPEGINYFQANKSTTFRNLGVALDVHYIGGWFHGSLAEDVLSFGTDKIKCTLACMQFVNGIFEPHAPFNGLLGLSYPSLYESNTPVQTFFDILVNETSIDNIFSLDLCGPYFTSEIQMTECGKFKMGSSSESLENNTIVYTPVIKEWFYEVIITDLKVGINHIPIDCWKINKKHSVVDTGATDVYFPKDVFDWTVGEIRKHVQHVIHNKFWVNETTACVPKEIFDIKIFPIFTISLYHEINSTFDLLISPELYLLPIEKEKSMFTCFKLSFGIFDSGALISASILRGFFVIFDRMNRRVGFANSHHYNRTNGFPGSVTEPKYTSQNLEMCKKKDESDSFSLSPILIVILFFAVVMTLLFLYNLISWILRVIVHPEECTDRNHLIASFWKHGKNGKGEVELILSHESTNQISFDEAI
ncbi:beta-secretase 1 [Caerostris extrusa]|uniref:Beta-secretase 1 n=1 Tax=Caerostris extrusa TaxID=172846 RepID=A0AAV4MK26_CAEEX|nr:beta-secretase 1 [Caerostris extrusa]